MGTSQEITDELLRERFRVDRATFLRYCFPDLFYRPFNPYHRSILDQLKKPFKERQQEGLTLLQASAAPRGIAKTTLSKGDLLHDAVYGYEAYIVVASAESRLAESTTRDLRNFFLAKPEQSEFARLYGPFEVQGGVEEFSVRFADGRQVGFLARSFGTQFRGANLAGQRPTKVLIDDGERPDRVRNPEIRKFWWDFLHQDILKAGPIDGGLLVDWRGTVLHPESVLAQLLKSPGWQSAKWQALQQWPDRPELWEDCRKIWANLSLGDLEARRMAALAFYEDHRREMDRGAVLLDPVAMPLFRFYQIIWSQGLHAALKELQNDPVDPTGRIFNSTKFARCRVEPSALGPIIIAADGIRVKSWECSRKILRWDPALGGEGGDYAALVPTIRDHRGYSYVVDGWLRQAKPSAQLLAMWTLAEKWGIRRVSLESNGFQSLLGESFRRERAERQSKGLFWQLDCTEEPSTEAKEIRIAAMEPDISNGWVQFADHLSPEFMSQWDQFPTGDHDDGPDATEGAWRRLGGSVAGMAGTQRIY